MTLGSSSSLHSMPGKQRFQTKSLRVLHERTHPGLF